ncbi:hypothetical protein CRD_02648 [Raphidiopsis brookii D9]|nr:hypothetical protein CRD_02648 [Raphidiopsis brookii D9]
MITFPQLIWTDIGLKLLSILILITINAFFVAAEFAMVTVRRARIHQLVQSGDAPAIAVEETKFPPGCVLLIEITTNSAKSSEST